MSKQYKISIKDTQTVTASNEDEAIQMVQETLNLANLNYDVEEVKKEKEYKYTYRFSEQTVDVRYYKVESNKKLTRSEMQDIAWSVEMTEGETYTDEQGKATFGGTECGDDAQYQMEEGSENLLDGDDYDW